MTELLALSLIGPFVLMAQVVLVLAICVVFGPPIWAAVALVWLYGKFTDSNVGE
jgi:hypothetical protein